MLVAFAISLSGCSAHSISQTGMANPASLNCVKQNGRLDIVKQNGGDVGYCVLPSGERIEEWSLFHRDGSK